MIKIKYCTLYIILLLILQSFASYGQIKVRQSVLNPNYGIYKENAIIKNASEGNTIIYSLDKTTKDKRTCYSINSKLLNKKSDVIEAVILNQFSFDKNIDIEINQFTLDEDNCFYILLITTKATTISFGTGYEAVESDSFKIQLLKVSITGKLLWNSVINSFSKGNKIDFTYSINRSNNNIDFILSTTEPFRLIVNHKTIENYSEQGEKLFLFKFDSSGSLLYKNSLGIKFSSENEKKSSVNEMPISMRKPTIRLTKFMGSSNKNNSNNKLFISCIKSKYTNANSIDTILIANFKFPLKMPSGNNWGVASYTNNFIFDLDSFKINRSQQLLYEGELMDNISDSLSNSSSIYLLSDTFIIDCINNKEEHFNKVENNIYYLMRITGKNPKNHFFAIKEGSNHNIPNMFKLLNTNFNNNKSYLLAFNIEKITVNHQEIKLKNLINILQYDMITNKISVLYSNSSIKVDSLKYQDYSILCTQHSPEYITIVLNKMHESEIINSDPAKRKDNSNAESFIIKLNINYNE